MSYQWILEMTIGISSHWSTIASYFHAHKDDEDPLNTSPFFHIGLRQLFHYFQSGDIFKWQFCLAWHCPSPPLHFQSTAGHVICHCHMHSAQRGCRAASEIKKKKQSTVHRSPQLCNAKPTSPSALPLQHIDLGAGKSPRLKAVSEKAAFQPALPRWAAERL